MNKNAANIYRFVIVDSIGQGMAGLTPSITLAKDSATTFTAATNSPSEVSSTDAPGLYEIALTATECNCDTLTIRVTLPTGQAPAILDVVQMQGASGGGATPQEIWEYTGGRTVTNTIPTAADNATAVWGASSRTLTNLNIQSELTTYGAAKASDIPDISGLATATDITNSQTAIISAMPTTAGLATSADVTSAQTAIIGAIPDISNLATANNVTTAQAAIIAAMPDVTGLSTFNASTDTVTIDATQAAGMQTATGFATPSDIPTDYAKPSDITAAQTALTSLLNSVLSGLYHWQVNDTMLTVYNNAGTAIGAYTLTKDSDGNIIAVTPVVTPNEG